MLHCSLDYGELVYLRSSKEYRCKKCGERFLPGSSGIWELTEYYQEGKEWVPDVRCNHCYVMNPGHRIICYHCHAPLDKPLVYPSPVQHLLDQWAEGCREAEEEIRKNGLPF